MTSLLSLRRRTAAHPNTANHKAETAAYNTIINDPCTLVAPALLTMDPASHLVGC